MWIGIVKEHEQILFSKGFLSDSFSKHTQHTSSLLLASYSYDVSLSSNIIGLF